MGISVGNMPSEGDDRTGKRQRLVGKKAQPEGAAIDRW